MLGPRLAFEGDFCNGLHVAISSVKSADGYSGQHETCVKVNCKQPYRFISTTQFEFTQSCEVMYVHIDSARYVR